MWWFGLGEHVKHRPSQMCYLSFMLNHIISERERESFDWKRWGCWWIFCPKRVIMGSAAGSLTADRGSLMFCSFSPEQRCLPAASLLVWWTPVPCSFSSATVESSPSLLPLWSLWLKLQWHLRPEVAVVLTCWWRPDSLLPLGRWRWPILSPCTPLPALNISASQAWGDEMPGLGSSSSSTIVFHSLPGERSLDEPCETLCLVISPGLMNWMRCLSAVGWLLYISGSFLQDLV